MTETTGPTNEPTNERSGKYTNAKSAGLRLVWFGLVRIKSHRMGCRTVFRIYLNTVFICSMLFQLANTIPFHNFSMRSNRLCELSDLEQRESERASERVRECVCVCAAEYLLKIFWCRILSLVGV